MVRTPYEGLAQALGLEQETPALFRPGGIGPEAAKALGEYREAILKHTRQVIRNQHVRDLPAGDDRIGTLSLELSLLQVNPEPHPDPTRWFTGGDREVARLAGEYVQHGDTLPLIDHVTQLIHRRR